jgi:hypothetical protein
MPSVHFELSAISVFTSEGTMKYKTIYPSPSIIHKQKHSPHARDKTLFRLFLKKTCLQAIIIISFYNYDCPLSKQILLVVVRPAPFGRRGNIILLTWELISHQKRVDVCIYTYNTCHTQWHFTLEYIYTRCIYDSYDDSYHELMGTIHIYKIIRHILVINLIYDDNNIQRSY